MVAAIRIPACIGWYDAMEIECVGGVNVETGITEPACTYVKHCALIRKYCDANAIDVNKYIKPTDPVDVEQYETMLAKAQEWGEAESVSPEESGLTPGLVEEQRVGADVAANDKVESKPTQTVGRKTATTKEQQSALNAGKRKVGRPPKVKASNKVVDEFAAIRPAIDEVGRGLAKVLNSTFVGAVNYDDVAVGDVFMKDMTPANGHRSRYVSFYVKPAKGRSIALCLMNLRKSGDEFTLELATEPENVKLEGVRHCSDGNFKSMIKDFKTADIDKFIKEFARLFGARRIAQGIHNK